MRAWTPTVAIVLVATLAAAVCAKVHPASLAAENPPAIDWATAAASDRPILWVDARSPSQYLGGHMPGAVQLWEQDWQDGLGRFLEAWQPETLVVVYCPAARCHAGERVAARIHRETGIEALVFAGGWEALKPHAGNGHHRP